MSEPLLISKLIDSNITTSFQGVPESAGDFLGKELSSFIVALLAAHGVSDSPKVMGHVHPHAWLEGAVYIAPGAKVEPTAMIVGPCFIGPNSEVRHGAYIRGNVLVGENCVVGHATEVKGSVFFSGAKAGHFAYVGDSILGNDVNLGAGTKLANLNIKGKNIFYTDPTSGHRLDSGLRKWGSVIGDRAQTGCNAVLSPGSLLFPDTAVLPCAHFRGTLTKGWAK